MRFNALLLAVILSVGGPSVCVQAPSRPKPPQPKPVKDVPPPNIAPTPAPSEPSRASRAWAMFPGSQSWPSEQELGLLAQACRSTPYRLGPDAPQTLTLENAVQDVKKVLTQWHQSRRIIVAPVGSAEINAWNTNAEDIRWAGGQPPKTGPDANFSLICVPQGISDFFGDAPQELEAIVAHEMGHAVDVPCYLDVRPKMLVPQLVQQACESRADAFALNAFVAQGKNPYAVAGAFGRIEMYSGDTSTGILARIANMSRDHPITPDRIRDLRRMLMEIHRTNQLQPLRPIMR